MEDKTYMQKYYLFNKKILLEKNKIRWNKNKAKYKISSKKWKDKNKDYLSVKHKEWYLKNKTEFNKKRRLQNKGIYWNKYSYRKEYLKQYQRNKRRTDLLFRLNSNISRQLRKNLVRLNLTKKDSTKNILPYSMAQLKEHLEKQFDKTMTWENFGFTWNIDHKTPITWYHTEKDLIKYGWALENLAPLDATKNKEKQNDFCSDVMLALSLIGR